MSSARLAELLKGVRVSGVRPHALPKLQGPVAIWGAGSLGRMVSQTLRGKGVAVAVVVDAHPMRQGGVLDGAPIIPPYLLCQHAPMPVFICIPQGYGAAMQLRQMGFEDYFIVSDGFAWPAFPVLDHARDILRVHDMLADDESRACYLAAIRMRQEGSGDCSRVSAYPQYRHERVKPLPGDMIVNGGGFIGNTADDFLWCTGRDCHIWSFEPCASVFAELEANLRKRGSLDLVTAVNMALWNEDAELLFNSPEPFSGNSSVQASGSERVRATSVDGFLAAQGITRLDLLELDVEGSEPAALLGAAEAIRRWRPRLQISLYHKPGHLWDLPLFIKELVPDYAMYVGHHSHTYGETVLYCAV